MRMKMTGAVFLLAALTVASASAQVGPLTPGEVSGRWVLRFLPSDQPGVTIRTDGNGPPEVALSVTPRSRGLACSVDGETADCAIRNGELVVTWTQSGVVTTFRVTERIGGGFSGNARMRVRPMPMSANIGPISMIRATAL